MDLDGGPKPILQLSSCQGPEYFGLASRPISFFLEPKMNLRSTLCMANVYIQIEDKSQLIHLPSEINYDLCAINKLDVTIEQISNFYFIQNTVKS